MEERSKMQDMIIDIDLGIIWKITRSEMLRDYFGFLDILDALQ